MAKRLYKYIVLVFLVILGQSMSFAQERIPMKLEKSGIYTIPCEVNGLKLSFVFDTGASLVHISLLEAAFMLKNGYINENDFIGTGNYILADGSIAENALINLKSIKIGNTIIKDVTACVSSNINASLLLGQSVLQKLGKYSVEGNYLIVYNDNGDRGNLHSNEIITDNQYQLWSTLSEDYEMGSFEDFKRDISDNYKRRKLYYAIIDEYDLPDFETFSALLGYCKVDDVDKYKYELWIALYDEYETGSFEEFKSYLADESNRRKLYYAIKNDYDLPDFDIFILLLGNQDNAGSYSYKNDYNKENTLSYYIALVSSQVNLREGPGKNYSIITKIPKDSYVLLSSDDKGQSYRKVLYIDKNIYGYVSNKYLTNLKKLEEDASGNLQPVSRNHKNTADIIINNNTSRNATINVGDNSYNFKPHETKTITNVKPGKYKIMASAPGVIPYVAIDNVEAGYDYSWEFYITTIRH